MILAAADYAGHKVAEPPPELSMAILTEKWGLPYSGGWMEQPAGLLEKMSLCLSVCRAITQYAKVEAGKRIDWKKEHPAATKTLGMVNQLRSNNG